MKLQILMRRDQNHRKSCIVVLLIKKRTAFIRSVNQLLDDSIVNNVRVFYGVIENEFIL